MLQSGEIRKAIVNIAKSLRTIKNSNKRCKSINYNGRGAKNRTKCNRYNDKYRKCPAAASVSDARAGDNDSTTNPTNIKHGSRQDATRTD